MLGETSYVNFFIDDYLLDFDVAISMHLCDSKQS